MRGPILGEAYTGASLALHIATPPVCHADVVAARTAGLAYLVTQQDGIGAWHPSGGLEVSATAEALSALAVSGMNNSSPYVRGAAWLANTDASSVDSLARKLIALKQAGMDTAADVTLLLNSRSSSSGYIWGSYKGYGASYPDTALGLMALRLSGGGYGDLVQLGVAVCEILRSQRSDGGWSYSSPPLSASASNPEPTLTSSSAVLPTAYILLELHEVRLATGWTTIPSCGTYNLATAVTNALNFIWTKRNPADGGFSDDATSTALETALAYRVIKKLLPGDSRGTDALNWLISHQNTDGSWPGGAFASTIVLASLDPAILPDTDHDGVPDPVEQRLGTNPGIPDARYIAKGNGQAIAGLTVPVALANEITLGMPFSFTLPAYGGIAPYVWTLGSGQLPPGLNLDAATGVISGTPTQLGDYVFTYIVTDSAATPSTQEALGRIAVYVSPPSLADGDINIDGMVNVADYLLTERFALGLAAPSLAQMQHADVYPSGAPDGVIDLRDALDIRNKALGVK